MKPIYDKTGREIVVGDILKVYHFTAALRRRRVFMYKQAVRIALLGTSGGRPGNHYMFFGHLDMTDDGYHQLLDGRILYDYEIVQSIDAAFEDRPRIAVPVADMVDA